MFRGGPEGPWPEGRVLQHREGVLLNCGVFRSGPERPWPEGGVLQHCEGVLLNCGVFRGGPERPWPEGGPAVLQHREGMQRCPAVCDGDVRRTDP